MAENDKPKAEAGKREKQPTAKKRNIQSLKHKAQNRSFKASVATSIRSFKESVSKNEKAATAGKLNDVYSLLDKGVKKGIFKANKANRVKSQMSSLASAK